MKRRLDEKREGQQSTVGDAAKVRRSPSRKPIPPLTAAHSLRPIDWLHAAGLVAAVFLVYHPSWFGGFLFDDDLHLLNNPVLKPGGLAKIWVPGGYLNYWPLTYTAYWLQYQLWGLHTLGYHLVNLTLHSAAALLVWRVLVRLKVPGAMFAAAIFTLHPVNVEGVAWIAQLKGILSLAFALISVLFYLGNERHPSRWRYGFAIIAFLLSGLAKGGAVTLPAVLLACAWWQRGRIERRDWLRILPFLLIAFLMAGFEVWGQRFVAQGDLKRSDDFFSRLAIAGCALWFYLGKLVFPINLSPIYPRWTIDELSVLSYLPGVAWIALLAWAWWKRRTWGRPAVMLLVCYAALLLPVLGFVTITYMQYSLVADHWQYMATIVPCAVFAGVSTTLARRFAIRPIAISSALALLVAVGFLSFRQSRTYANSDEFYETVLSQNPDCWLAEYDYAADLTHRRKFDSAILHYRKSLAINPDYGKAQNNLGAALVFNGQLDLAIAHYQKVLKTTHGRAELHDNFAVALGRRGRIDEAIAQCREASAVDPGYAPAHYNLARILLGRGDIASAIAEFQKAIELDPNYAEAHADLATALAGRGQIRAALAHYRKAIAIKPDLAELRCEFGKALYADGQFDAALAEYQKALAIDPNYAEAHSNLANALARRGQVASAIDHYEKAIELKPNYAEAQNNLGVALVSIGRVDSAIAHCRKALEIKPDYAEAHVNLANALVGRGEFDSAIAEYEKALAIKPDYAAARQNLAAVRAELAKRRNTPDRSGAPYRQPPNR